MQANYALLLTACINPKATIAGKIMVKRSDPTVRLSDYFSAIKYWMHYDDPRIKSIVFVENSGYDLAPLLEFANSHNTYKRRIEFIQCPASKIPDGLHYGYSELEMIDYAFQNSRQLESCDFFIKATGRLYFPKLSKLLNRISPKQQFVSDSRDYEYRNTSKHYVITTLFVVQRDFYETILFNSKTKMVSMKVSHIETLYYQILKPLYREKPERLMLRFPFNVDPVGVGAHWNVSYTSFRKKSESFVRSISRRVLPSLWV